MPAASCEFPNKILLSATTACVGHSLSQMLRRLRTRRRDALSIMGSPLHPHRLPHADCPNVQIWNVHRRLKMSFRRATYAICGMKWLQLGFWHVSTLQVWCQRSSVVHRIQLDASKSGHLFSSIGPACSCHPPSGHSSCRRSCQGNFENFTACRATMALREPRAMLGSLLTCKDNRGQLFWASSHGHIG